MLKQKYSYKDYTNEAHKFYVANNTLYMSEDLVDWIKVYYNSHTIVKNDPILVFVGFDSIFGIDIITAININLIVKTDNKVYFSIEFNKSHNQIEKQEYECIYSLDYEE